MTLRIFWAATGANTFGSGVEDSEIPARTQLANARFSRLVDCCADALAESIRATDELSQRLTYLRKEIESHACHGPTTPTVDPLARARRRDQEEPAA